MEDKIPNQIPRCPCCGLSRLATTCALHQGCEQGWFPIMEGIPNLSYYDQSLIMVRKPERGWQTCKWSPSQLSLMPPRFILLNQHFLCSVRQCACNQPRASLALVSSGTGQYDETFTLSPSRSCMISFGAASCSLMTPPYHCPCLVSFVPFCIGITCSLARSMLDLSLDSYLHHRSQLPCTSRVAV